MKKYLILFLLVASTAFAANTFQVTDDGSLGSGRSYITYGGTFDSTGVKCVSVFPYYKHLIFVDIQSGTATYDIETAVELVPDEAGDSSDLTDASDITASDAYEGEFAANYLCVRIDACSSCDIDVYGYSIE